MFPLVREFDKLIEEDRQVLVRSSPSDIYLELLNISSQAEDRKSEQLSSARQQIASLKKEVSNLQSQLEDSRQVVTDLQDENQNLRDQLKAEEMMFSPLVSLRSPLTPDKNLSHTLETAHSVDSEDVTQDVKVPEEESFGKENYFTASTPFIGKNLGQAFRRRSYSLDLNFVVRTPIVPGRCPECLNKPHHDSSGEHQDSPSLPWCPHSATANLTGLAPVRSSVALFSRNVLTQQHPHLFY